MRKISLKKLLARILTIGILAPIVIGLISFDMQPYGSLPFLVFIISIAIMSLNEFYTMAYQKEAPFFLTGHFLSITVISLAFFTELQSFWHSPIIWTFSFILLVFFLVELSLRRIFFSDRKLAITLRGVFYIGLFYAFFILIRNLPYGKELVFSVLFTIWALDIMAYVVGISLGRHKLSPDISPKKTLEGAIGGFCAAVLASFLLSSGVLQDAFPSTVNRFFAIHIGVWHSLILGAIIGILGQTGTCTSP
jgi:phosphatidate cytidylyltransferase